MNGTPTKKPTRRVYLDGEPIELDPNSGEPILLRSAAALVAGGIIDALVGAGLELSGVTEASIHIVILGLAVLAAGWLARKKVLSGKTAARLLDAATQGKLNR